MKYLRIKKNADFQKIFNKGKKVFSPNFTLLYFSAPMLALGVAVSKKHGNAVKRNRIKRLLRAAFAETSDVLDKAYSVILIPKVGGEYAFEAFKKSLTVCFKKVNECGKR